MELGLSGKVAIVAGGARGCGFSVTQTLAQEGARVVFSSRSQPAIDHALKRLRDAGLDAHGVVADINVKADSVRLVEEVRSVYGDPSVLVINPANSNLKGGFEATTDEAFASSNDDWIMSHVYLLREVLPAMKAAGWGRIVSLGSVSQKMPSQTDNFYTGNIRVSSAALIKTLSGEYSQFGITANTICTGPFMSELSKSHFDQAPDFDPQTVVARSASRRFGQPSEMGAIVTFLCSELAAYITGEAIRVDGGYSHNLF